MPRVALHPLSEVEVPALGVGAAPVARHEDRGHAGADDGSAPGEGEG